MNKANLYVVPRSQAECNQLQSFIHSHNLRQFEGDNKTPFKVGVLVWFWHFDQMYTTPYINAPILMGEQVTPNELALRYNTL